MPINISSFLLPRQGSKYFLLEDIYLRGGFQVHLDHEARDAIPETSRKFGMLVFTQDDKKLWQLDEDMVTWAEFKVGGDDGGEGEDPKPRQTVEHTIAEIPPQSYGDFSLPMGNGVIVYALRVSAPCQLEVHETKERIDGNPYRFIATEEQLYDDGTSVMEDGTIVRNRRYSIWANMDAEPNGDIHFRILNPSDDMTTVTVYITFKPFEA